MRTRLATLDDAEALRTIYNAEVIGSTVTFDLVPRSVADQEAWLRRHAGAYPAVVSVDDGGNVTGFGSLSPYRERPAYATTVESSVYVDAAHRKLGVGKLLLDDLILLATKHGFHAMIARAVGDNGPSIALHQRCGFELVGVEHEVGRKFGQWLDVAVLQRQL